MASGTMKLHGHMLPETSAIVNSKPLLFIAFSLLFLPLTITTISTIQSDVTFKTLTSSPYVTFKTLIKLIPIILSTFTAISLIINTTLQIIINPKAKSHTFKSLSNPLLSTVFTQANHLLIISVAFTYFSFFLKESIPSLRFPFDVLLVSFAFAICLLLVTFLFFKAILGFKSQPFSFWLCSLIILLYAVFALGVSLWRGVIVFDFRPVPKWLFVVQVCANYMFCAMIVTQFVVGNTVLYVRCKVASGQLAVRTAVADECQGSRFFLTTMLLQFVWIGIVYIGLEN